MVATIDGKTVSGARDEPVGDIGSDVDHQTMRQIEGHADAVLIGAGSLRATKNLHYGPSLVRVVVSNSCDLPYESRFFTECPDKAYVATKSSQSDKVAQGVKTLLAGNEELDWTLLLKKIREEVGVEWLLVEGGSEINAALLHMDLVDELFLTIAPLIKLGAGTPTYAGGVPHERGKLTRFRLVSTIVKGDELYLRYRRHR